MANDAPTVKIFFDENDMKGEELFNEFGKTRRIELLEEAAAEYEKSTNPDKEKIAALLRGLSHKERGKQEKDIRVAIQHFLKALNLFKQSVGTQDKFYKETQLLYLDRKMQRNRKQGKPYIHLFKKRAVIYESLGDEKQKHGEMALYSLYQAFAKRTLDGETLNNLEEMVSHAEKSGNEDVIHKTKGIMHRIKAQMQPTLEEGIEEMNNSIIEIEKTSDQNGKEEAYATLAWLKSVRSQTSKEEREALVIEAAEGYERAGLNKRSHELKAQIHLGKLNGQQNIEESINLYLKAAEEFSKTENVRMQKMCLGHAEIGKATLYGLMKDNRDKLSEHLNKANKYYAEVGNVVGVQYTAGLGLLFEALRHREKDNKDLLEKSAMCLESIGQKELAAIARAEFYHKKAYEVKDKKEQRQYMIEEKNHLERLVLEKSKKTPDEDKIKELQVLGIPTQAIDLITEARVNELDGLLEDDWEIRKSHFRKAKEKYISIQEAGNLRQYVLTCLFWCDLFLENLEGARKYLNELKILNPKHVLISIGGKSIDTLIKAKYSQTETEKLIKDRLSIPLEISLNTGIKILFDDRKYPSDFFNLSFAVIQRACESLEQNRSTYLKMTEPQLRDHVKILANNLCSGTTWGFTGETFNCEGKTDLFTQNPEDKNDKFISECKIWNGESGFIKGLNQLIGRYVSKKDKVKVLINFIKTSTIEESLKKAKKSIIELDGKATFNDISDQVFVSNHENTGMIIHLFVDLIPKDKRKLI